MRDLNTFYRGEPALHELDCDPGGFEWIDCNDSEAERHQPAAKGQDRQTTRMIVVCNFTPVPRHNYRVGVPRGGRWEEVLNSDAPLYGGSGQGNLGGVDAAPVSCHGRDYMLTVTVPPLGMVVFKKQAKGERGA